MISKNILKIPSGIHYLSDYVTEDGEKFKLPNGILNKELTGCGGTTLALEDDSKTIICSPRIKLLENKKAQYPDTLLVKGGVSSTSIYNYLSIVSKPKILVTYDSLYKVIDCLDNLQEWKVVIDEFQCLLNDSTFKADTEMKLLEKLKGLPYVTYLSATPILDKYLSQIEYFDDVPYYQLDWMDKYKVQVHRRKTNNPIASAQNIVREYLKGNYPILPEEDGSELKSTECVIFLNSVTNIVNIVKNTHLKPEDVNIIVANNEDNDEIIKKLGEGFGNGRIPLKGEHHKMITMCTSTAYMGVDFYSTCATTFVISDCKRPNTSVDIATELSQIAGRQRLDCNPFRYHLFFIYNTNVEDTPIEEFEDAMAYKLELTKKEVEFYNQAPEGVKEKLAKDNIRNRKILGYSETYTMYDENTHSFTYNKLAQISDRFAFDVQQYNYKNGILVRKQLEDTGKFDLSDNQVFDVYKESVAQTIANNTFIEKMKDYCEHKDSRNMFSNYIADQLARKTPELKIYYDALGSGKIKALGYQESKLKKEYAFLAKISGIRHKVDMAFKKGDKLPKAEIKSRLQSIYDEMGLDKKAKATELSGFGFTLKECKITKDDGSRVNGFLIN